MVVEEEDEEEDKEEEDGATMDDMQLDNLLNDLSSTVFPLGLGDFDLSELDSTSAAEQVPEMAWAGGGAAAQLEMGLPEASIASTAGWGEVEVDAGVQK